MIHTHNKIRLHKAVQNFVNDSLYGKYTNPEIQANIATYGVYLDDELEFDRLLWIIPSQIIHIEHWPQRIQGDTNAIKIMSENNFHIILFKPKGVVSVAGAGHRDDNVVKWLVDNCQSQQKFDPIDFPNRGLVNRIDKETQGLLLVAKSPTSHEWYQQQFKRRLVIKKYLAIHNGIFDYQVDLLSWQSRDIRNPLRQLFFWDLPSALKYSKESRHAHSLFRPIAICKELNLTLSEITIKTGRMHQIRLQSEALGFPLFEEKLYNHKSQIPNSIKLDQTKIPVIDLPTPKFQKIHQRLDSKMGYTLVSNTLGLKEIDQSEIYLELYPVGSLSC